MSKARSKVKKTGIAIGSIWADAEYFLKHPILKQIYAFIGWIVTGLAYASFSITFVAGLDAWMEVDLPQFITRLAPSFQIIVFTALFCYFFVKFFSRMVKTK